MACNVWEIAMGSSSKSSAYSIDDSTHVHITFTTHCCYLFYFILFFLQTGLRGGLLKFDLLLSGARTFFFF